MKAVIKICAFCAIFALMSLTFVSAQEKAPPQTGEKKLAEEVNSVAAIEPSAITEETNPYKNQKNDKYRIGFQDAIEVQVYRQQGISGRYEIASDGTIRMPRVNDPIIAVCKTETELSNTITAHLKSWLKDPFVTVRVSEQRSQSFAVIGAVQKPGNYLLSRRIRLLELLALAGGPDVENAGAKIQVARLGNLAGCDENVQKIETVDSNTELVGFNLNEVMQGKQNPWMNPGDIVSVLIAEEAYVVGNVKEPKKIILRDRKTLTQALADAGGTDAVANTGKVIIQRLENNGVKKELVFDLKDIRSQKIADPVLQGNDIVQVSSDKTKSAIEGVKSIFKNGLPSIFYRF
jgi:polysaccharide export outer membrane protein